MHADLVVDPLAPTPLYQQLVELLRAQIHSAEPGDRLPSESRLMQEHGLARDTIRAAYRVLEDEGLVIALAGRGRFVRPAD